MDLSDRQRLSAIAHTGSLLCGPFSSTTIDEIDTRVEELDRNSQVLVRLGIGFGHANVRLAGALVALLTFAIGLEASATPQSSALLVVLIAVILVRPRRAMVCQ